jgi:glycosyltransferase involved in cell wall biosynthesis
MLRFTREEPGSTFSPRSIGIVIPTHNRSSALLECLTHLENQTFNDFEVIVVDDGSTDDTARQMEEYTARGPLRIRYVRQENSGPAKARNLGVSILQSRICLFLGDDIFASPTLVEQHLRLHADNPELKVAALGLTRWSTSGQEVTPFMTWLDEANVQFAYPLLLAGEKPDWCHFYTSNVSAKTELLKRFAFNEQFPYAAMEDSELAYRIKKHFGLEIHFIPDAVADHLHPTTFRHACRRMLRVGYSCGLFYDLWPEQRPLTKTGLRQNLAVFVARNPRLLRPMECMGHLLTRLVCPNPFMSYVLECHLEAGFESRRKGELVRG